MPLQSEAQLTGYEGERWFRSQLPRGWIPQRPETDVGVDYVVVISESGDLDKREFRVQVKSSKSLSRRSGQIALPPIKRSTIDYWFLSPLPTLIVAYDEGENRGYFRWHHEIFDEIAKYIDARRDTVPVSVPERNVLDDAGWRTIRNNLRAHYSELTMALAEARNSRSVTPTVHNLTSAVRQLNSIDHQPIPLSERSSEQHAILAAAEMMQHRFILTTIADLRKEVRESSDADRRLREWSEAYEARVISAFPNFRSLTDWNSLEPDFQILVRPSLAAEQRWRLIQAVLEIVMQLMPGQFNQHKSELTG